MKVVPDGGVGIGVNPHGVEYPFRFPSNDVAGLFADFYLGHRVPVVLPMRVSWLYGFTQPAASASSVGTQSSSSGAARPSPTHASDLWVVDANDETVFYSPDAGRYRAVNWGGRFRIHEWISDTAVCRAVQHTGQNDAEDAQDYEIEIEPTSAELDARTVEQWPVSLTALLVGGLLVNGPVEFENGYNWEFQPTKLPSVLGGRAGYRLRAVADPGSGAGLYPACDDPEPVVRKVNQVAGDALGRFRLTSGGCYWIGRGGGGVPTPTHGLRIAADCPPCYTCDDVVNSEAAVRRLLKDYQGLGQRAETTRDTYAVVKARWMAQKDCRESRPVRVEILSFKAGVETWVTVKVTGGNFSKVCRGPLSLTLTWTTNGSVGTVVEDTTWIWQTSTSKPEPYVLGGVWPVYTAAWETLDPRKAGKLTFMMNFASVPEGNWGTLSVRALLNGEEIGVAVDTTTLKATA